jgi:hypothetical protein
MPPELKDLLTDSKVWMAGTALARLVVPYLGVDVPEGVWMALDGLILAILAPLAGVQLLRKRKERQSVSIS